MSPADRDCCAEHSLSMANLTAGTSLQAPSVDRRTRYRSLRDRRFAADWRNGRQGTAAAVLFGGPRMRQRKRSPVWATPLLNSIDPCRLVRRVNEFFERSVSKRANKTSFTCRASRQGALTVCLQSSSLIRLFHQPGKRAGVCTSNLLNKYDF